MLRRPPLLAGAPSPPGPTAQPLPPWLSYSAWTTSWSPVATTSTAADGRVRTRTIAVPGTAYSVMYLPLPYSGPTPHPPLGTGWTVPAPTTTEPSPPHPASASSHSSTPHASSSSTVPSTSAGSSAQSSTHQPPQPSTTRLSSSSGTGSTSPPSPASSTVAQPSSYPSPASLPSTSPSTSVATSSAISSAQFPTATSSPASPTNSSPAATSPQASSSVGHIPSASVASPQPERHSRLSGGQIAGIAVGSFFGALAILALLTLLLFLLWRRRQRRKDPYKYEDRYTRAGLLGPEKLEDGAGGDGPERPGGLMARFLSTRYGGKGAYAVVDTGAAAPGAAMAGKNGKQRARSLHSANAPCTSVPTRSAGLSGSYMSGGPSPASLFSTSGARYPAQASRSTGISDRTLSGGAAGLGAFAGAAERRRSSNRRPDAEEEENKFHASGGDLTLSQRGAGLSSASPLREPDAAGRGTHTEEQVPMPPVPGLAHSAPSPPPQRRTWAPGTAALTATAGAAAAAAGLSYSRSASGTSSDGPAPVAMADVPARRVQGGSIDHPVERNRTVTSTDTSAWGPSLTVTSPSVSTFHTGSVPHRPSQQLLYGRTLAARPELGVSNETFGHPDSLAPTPDPYVDATSEPWERDSRSTNSRRMPGAFSPSPLRVTPDENTAPSWMMSLALARQGEGEEQTPGADRSDQVLFDGRRLSSLARDDERTGLLGVPQGPDDAVYNALHSSGTPHSAGYSAGTPTPQGLASSELDPMSISPVIAPLPQVSTAALSVPPTDRPASPTRSWGSSSEAGLHHSGSDSPPPGAMEHVRSNSLGIIFGSPSRPQAGGSPPLDMHDGRPYGSPRGASTGDGDGESSPLYPPVSVDSGPRSSTTAVGTDETGSPRTGVNGDEVAGIMEVSSHFPSPPSHPGETEPEPLTGLDLDNRDPSASSAEGPSSAPSAPMDPYLYGEDTWMYGAPLSDIEERSEAQSMSRTGTSDWPTRARPASQALTLGRPSSQASSFFVPMMEEGETESLHPPSWRPSPRVRTATEKAYGRLAAGT